MPEILFRPSSSFPPLASDLVYYTQLRQAINRYDLAVIDLTTSDSNMNSISALSLLTCVAVCTTTASLQDSSVSRTAENAASLELGNFSVSLNVEDLEASQSFYEKLGFKKKHGEKAMNYVIMQNDTATIGLFHGMFEDNILTFNPGWNRDSETLDEFTDVREIQKQLMASGITPISKADPASTGPASFVIADPDGNTIFVDQHVPAPKR